MQVGERIRIWRKKSGLTLKDVSEKIKISQGSLSDIENNNSYPSFDTIQSFCLHTTINLEWLVSGIGKMFDENKSAPATGVEKKINVDDSYTFPISSDVFRETAAVNKIPGSDFSQGDFLGMTKREIFGLVAMHAVLSNPKPHKKIFNRDTEDKKICGHFFAHVVEYVDQTLEKLGEKQPES